MRGKVRARSVRVRTIGTVFPVHRSEHVHVTTDRCSQLLIGEMWRQFLWAVR